MEIKLNVSVTFDAVPDLLHAMQVLAATCKPAAAPTQTAIAPAPSSDEDAEEGAPKRKRRTAEEVAADKAAKAEAKKGKKATKPEPEDDEDEEEEEEEEQPKRRKKKPVVVEAEDDEEEEEAEEDEDEDEDDDILGASAKADEVSLEAVKKATQEAVFADSANRAKLKKILAEYGADKATDLNKKHWKDYLAKVKKLTK